MILLYIHSFLINPFYGSTLLKLGCFVMFESPDETLELLLHVCHVSYLFSFLKKRRKHLKALPTSAGEADTFSVVSMFLLHFQLQTDRR